MIVDKIKKREPTAKRKENKVDIPVGKWVKCDKCKEIIYKETIRENMNICPNCGGYFRMHINRRLESIIDEGTYQKFDLNIDTTNPLNLEDYTKKIKALREKTGLQEAVSAGKGKINGSQGQQRTAALSLKLSEIELVKLVIKDTPVLLLDDVLSELDSNRQNFLINSIGDIQTIVTCTGLEEFINNRMNINKIFKVTDGHVVNEN